MFRYSGRIAAPRGRRPRRPLLTASAVPVGAVLLYGAGALAVLGGVFTTVSVLITVVVAAGMLRALMPLCPPRIWLRGLIAAVLVIPLVVIPVESAEATHAMVLRSFGVRYLGTVTAVQDVRAQNSTTHRCTVRYTATADPAPRYAVVGCSGADRVGDSDPIDVAPGNRVPPELERSVLAGNGDAGPGALVAAVFVLLVAGGAIGAGALHARRTSHSRRSGSGLSAAGGGPPGSPRG